MQKTVVLFLSDLQSGGSEWFAIRLAQGLARLGWKPVFLLAQCRGELLEQVQRDYEVVCLSGTGYSPFGLLRALPSCVRFLIERRPEAMIAGLPLLNALASAAVWLSGAKLRLILVEHMRLDLSETVLPSWKQKTKAFLVRRAYAFAQHIVAVSQTARADLIDFTGLDEARLQTIYNPVIPDTFKELATQAPDHPWLADKAVPTLVSIGRLLPVKDQATLLRAVALARKQKDLRLVLLGEGRERLALESLVTELGLQECVSMPGTTQNVFALLQAADLFVLSSLSEAFGNVLVEALACGTPVVSTDCGGPREILENGRFGLLVPPGDPVALSRALLQALETKWDHESLIERGQTFTVERAAQAYSALLNG